MTTFDTRTCTGCRTCEMACSFHHSGVFQPSISSIEIAGSPKEGFRIVLHAAPHDDHRACDGCRELKDPLCVSCCPLVARDELKELIGRSREPHTR
jgi:Fe-S-cluster-containing dehydrogenase component